MMEKVALSSKEQKRLHVLNEVLAGHTTGKIVTEVVGLPLRHTRRLIAACRRKAASALAHGHRGRSPVNRFREESWETLLDTD
jgi:hypothetical protein